MEVERKYKIEEDKIPSLKNEETEVVDKYVNFNIEQSYFKEGTEMKITEENELVIKIRDEFTSITIPLTEKQIEEMKKTVNYEFSVPYEIRIRKKENEHIKKHYLTVKTKGTLFRGESEIDLTDHYYTMLHFQTFINSIQKRRYIIPLNLEECGLSKYKDKGIKLNIELDIYEGKLLGLIIAEVEFKLENPIFYNDINEEILQMSKSFIPPSWFGQDVTETLKYKNKNLAFEGIY